MRDATAKTSPSECLINLLELSHRDTTDLMEQLDWPAYRADQLLRWIHQGRVRDVDGMSDIPKRQREQLRAIARLERFGDPAQVRISEDGTRKFLFRLSDGMLVETVSIPDAGRLTLCLSSQVGCTLDCRFCLTGRMGLRRNLKAHEIVDQVLSVMDQLEPGQQITNFVFMGMGEPLANADAVGEAIRRLTNRVWGLGISAKRITVSTAGLASRLSAFSTLGVNLAVSLNGTTNEQRARLMPAVNRRHSLSALIAACRAYPLAPRQKLTFEYVLLADINDSEDDARRLIKLLHDIRCKVNLIPFNEFAGGPYRRPDSAAILRFQSRLRRAGFDVLVRKSRGRDILGACGQLGSGSPPKSLAVLPPAGAAC